MYKYILTITSLFFFFGCAQEATYVDHEFGKAQNDAFDQQVAYKNPENSGVTPTGMAGIHSERIMDTYQYSFDRDSDNAPDNNFSRGFEITTDD